MTGEILAGTTLVILTWLLAIVVLIGMGLGPAMMTTGYRLNLATLRSALWWGLTLATIAVVTINLWAPLRSTGATVSFAVLTLLLILAALTTVLRHRPVSRGAMRVTLARWQALIVVPVLAGVAYAAVAALGPVTNYDSGLYHLGAISYAGDYSTIPGLANLYFPLGYGNSEFPLAAFLGNGPWDGQGFRLLNGLLLAACGADLLMRMASRRLSPGFFVLTAGTAIAWVPLLALSDYWLTSPTSDSAALLLTVVAAAYLVDAVARDSRWLADASVAIVLSFVLLSMRPMMVSFAIPLIVVVLIRGIRMGRGRTSARVRVAPTVALLVTVGVLGTVALTVRDYVLSGWLQYPLSVLPFDVEWRAVDPVWMRTATLGAARDPNLLWDAAQGWGWVGAWFGRLPSQWETYAFLLASVVAIASVVAAAHRGLRWRAVLLTMAPSACAVVAWWVASPPAFRFIWGPLFTLAIIPLGWSGACLYRSRTSSRFTGPRVLWVWSAAVLVALLPVVAYSAAARLNVEAIREPRTMTLGPVSIEYVLAPVQSAPTQARVLASGLRVLVPIQSDQCWTVYPLCTAQLDDTVRLRGESLAEGFLP